jgi:hypothetical protein
MDFSNHLFALILIISRQELFIYVPEKLPFTHISQNGVAKSLSNVAAVHRTTTVCFGGLTRNSPL